MPPGLPTASTPLKWCLDTGRTRLVGRRVSWTLDGVELEFTVEDITVAAGAMSLGAGQADELKVAANDVIWGTHAFPAAQVTFHNIHTRPGQHPALVSAPIDVQLRVSARDIAERIESRVPWLRVEITESGELRVRHRRRPDGGWVGFTLTPQGDGLAVNVRTLTVAGRSWTLPSRVRPIRIPLSLPADARVTEVLAMPESLDVLIRVDERRVDIRTAMSFLSADQGPRAAD